MGNDGARELKLMKDKGALTIVQNKESCVIFGTLGEAVKLEGFKKILSPWTDCWFASFIRVIIINVKEVIKRAVARTETL